MTVSLDLPLDVERALLAEAKARGLPLDKLVREVLLARQSEVTGNELTAEEWVREFKAWSSSHADDDLSVLSDKAISRDFIYGERGL